MKRMANSIGDDRNGYSWTFSRVQKADGKGTNGSVILKSESFYPALMDLRVN